MAGLPRTWRRKGISEIHESSSVSPRRVLTHLKQHVCSHSNRIEPIVNIQNAKCVQRKLCSKLLKYAKPVNSSTLIAYEFYIRLFIKKRVVNYQCCEILVQFWYAYVRYVYVHDLQWVKKRNIVMYARHMMMIIQLIAVYLYMEMSSYILVRYLSFLYLPSCFFKL